MNQPRGKRRRPKHPNSHGRLVALQALYQHEVAGREFEDLLDFAWLNEPLPEDVLAFTRDLIGRVIHAREDLDREIRTLSRKDFTQISSINRVILRMGLCELRAGRASAGIIIDDLLNLTRTYDGEQSVAFVNGILDSFNDRLRDADSLQ